MNKYDNELEEARKEVWNSYCTANAARAANATARAAYAAYAAARGAKWEEIEGLFITHFCTQVTT